MKHLTPKQKLIVCLSLLAIVFSCAACGTQAEEGSIYVATSNDAEVVTVENMTRVVRGDVIEGTVAYAERETFFEISQGSAGSETILLTEVFHNGEGVSFDGSYDFIKDNPEDAGWKKLEAGTAEWLSALETLCACNRTAPEDLKKLCDAR
jgi:hypothetical protein